MWSSGYHEQPDFEIDDSLWEWWGIERGICGVPVPYVSQKHHKNHRIVYIGFG